MAADATRGNGVEHDEEVPTPAVLGDLAGHLETMIAEARDRAEATLLDGYDRAQATLADAVDRAERTVVRARDHARETAADAYDRADQIVAQAHDHAQAMAAQTLTNAERVKRRAEATKVVATQYHAEAKRLLTEARQALTDTDLAAEKTAS